MPSTLRLDREAEATASRADFDVVPRGSSRTRFANASRSSGQQLLTRDVELVDVGRDPDRLRRLMTAYVAMTAQVVEDKTLWETAGISRKTAVADEQLLKTSS